MVIDMDKNNIEYHYWKIFNSLIRFIGFMFCVVGCIVGIYSILTIIYPKFSTTASTIDDIVLKLVFSAIPLIVAFLGFLITRSQPYFSNHIKKWMQQKNFKGNG